jgi:hypothetical protein
MANVRSGSADSTKDVSANVSADHSKDRLSSNDSDPSSQNDSADHSKGVRSSTDSNRSSRNDSADHSNSASNGSNSIHDGGKGLSGYETGDR